MTYPFYDLCFTISGYSGTKDFDNTYLGYDRFIEIRPTVKLIAFFETPEAVDSFTTWWELQADRGRKTFVVPILFFGKQENFGIQQLTPLVNSANENTNTQTISFSAQIMFDPSTVENARPVADPLTVYIQENVRDNYIEIHGSDADGDPLDYTIQVTPAAGTLRGNPPALLYTPDPSFVGTDCFSFVTSDYWEDSEPAVVTIEVGSGEIPLHRVEYQVTGPVRVTGNFYYSFGNDIWERGFGGFLTAPEGLLRIASSDHKLDIRDNVITSCTILAWGGRLDFTAYLKNKALCTMFLVAEDAGVCIGNVFTSMFENTGIQAHAYFSLIEGIYFRRMYALSALTFIDIPDDLVKGVYYEEIFMGSAIEKIIKLNTSRGQYFTRGFMNCEQLNCIGLIDTTNKLNTTDMFTNTPLLLNPDNLEQSDIMEEGILFDQQEDCGVISLGITQDNPTATCHVDAMGGTCVSLNSYTIAYANELYPPVTFNWSAWSSSDDAIVTITAGQTEQTCTVSVEDGFGGNITVQCELTDGTIVVPDQATFEYDRSYEYLELELPKSYSQINLRDFIDDNNPLLIPEIIVTNNKVNCSLTTGDLTGLTVTLVNNNEFQGFPKNRTDNNSSRNSGLEVTSPLTLINNGWVLGAGGYGGRGGEGDNDSYQTNKSEEKYNGINDNQNVWFAYCNNGGVVRFFWEYSSGGWDGNCNGVGPVGTPGADSGTVERGAYKGTYANDCYYSVIRRWTETTSRNGGDGGLGGEGEGYNQGRDWGEEGDSSSPSGGNDGGEGGRGGDWGDDGATGERGEGGGDYGESGYDGAPATIGVSFLKANSIIGLNKGAVI